MKYHVMFPDFSGFQIDIPRPGSTPESRKRGTGGCMREACADLWPDPLATGVTAQDPSTGRLKAGGPPH
ncbi:hypothetical protein HNP00_003218 [Arthrobacter sp. AZCC_0090]|nr:hypothetical protein [Arthrobacter sp. AZCC_0090]